MKAVLLGGDVGKAALGGAIGGAVSEMIAETIGLSRNELKAEFEAERARLGNDFKEDAFIERFTDSQQGAGKWGRLGAAMAALLAKADISAASAAADTAVENNNKWILGLIAAGHMSKEALKKAVKNAGKTASKTTGKDSAKKAGKAVDKGKEPLHPQAQVNQGASGSKGGLSKEQPWNVRKGQEWKEKIVGRAQKTGTEGHDIRSYREAIRAAKREDVDKVFLNRGIKKASDHPIGRPNTRPDVTIRTKDGKIHQVEVPSKTDYDPILRARMEDAKSRLPKNMRGETDLKYINGHPK
jgi:hypothetical protein